MVISSFSHADLLGRLMRFSLIGACLLRIDKNSAFHVERFIFESVWEHLKFSISLLRSSKMQNFQTSLRSIFDRVMILFLVCNFDVCLHVVDRIVIT